MFAAFKLKAVTHTHGMKEVLVSRTNGSVTISDRIHRWTGTRCPHQVSQVKVSGK